MEQWQKVPAGQWKHCEVQRRLILENALRRFTEKVLFNTGFKRLVIPTAFPPVQPQTLQSSGKCTDQPVCGSVYSE